MVEVEAPVTVSVPVPVTVPAVIAAEEVATAGVVTVVVQAVAAAHPAAGNDEFHIELDL